MGKIRRGWYDPDSDRYALILGFGLFFFVYLPLSLLAPCTRNFEMFVAVAISVVVVTLLSSSKFGMLFVRRLFKKRFGFKPSKLAGMKVAEQQTVDHVLSSWAGALSGCFTKEASIREKQFEKSRTKVLKEYLEDLKERETELRSAARIVKKNKRQFWSAYMLAKALGYKVRAKYSDYIEF